MRKTYWMWSEAMSKPIPPQHINIPTIWDQWYRTPRTENDKMTTTIMEAKLISCADKIEVYRYARTAK